MCEKRAADRTACSTPKPLAVVSIAPSKPGFATWWKQGRYRKEARAKAREVQSLMQEISQRKPAPPAPAPASTPPLAAAALTAPHP